MRTGAGNSRQYGLAAATAITVLAGTFALPAIAGAAPAPADPVRETVYVVSGIDSDNDGRQDRIATHISRPATSGGTSKVSSIIQASPYYGEAPSRPTGGRPVPIEANRKPGHFGGWYDDYFIARGYAAVEVDMQGTGLSEGCPGTGGDEDTQSVKAVIDWLNGRAQAERADGTPVAADWSTGNAGMLGVSYDGTLPIAVAATGVPGLKTIVPIGAISSWYDYARAPGIAFHGWGNNYASWLAKLVANSRAMSACAGKFAAMDVDDADGSYVYNAFWQQRNYRDKVASITASVWQVHGQWDDNVKTNQAGPLWTKLAEGGKDRRIWLYDDEHINPFDTDATMIDQLGRWMDFWVNGVDNGALAEPQATVDRPGGVRNTYPSWPASNTSTFGLSGPGNNAAGTLLSTGAGASGAQLLTDDVNLLQKYKTPTPQAAVAGRLAYLTAPFSGEARLSGSASARIAVTATTASTPLNLLVVHYDSANNPVRIVTRGAIDMKNRLSLTSDVPLTPGQQYTPTVVLEPRDYTFPAGSRLGLIVSANNWDYIEPDYSAAKLAVQFGVSTLTLPGTFPAPSACANPAYLASTIYNTDDRVSDKGRNWRAKWWTQGQEPGTTGQWGVWEDLGAC
jgi:X-Pro dipeptidyl-peptidase